jgi:hypothetical protein
MSKIKNLKDIEFEISLLEKCKHSPKTDISVGTLLECLSVEIESCISYEEVKEDSFFGKIFNKMRWKKFNKSGSWDPSWKFPELSSKSEEVEETAAMLRLKTALTAFKLHSGPFAKHPLFGNLDKDEWEGIHVKVAEYIVDKIDVEGKDKFRNGSDKKYFGKKKYYNNKKKFHNKKKKARDSE